MDRILDLPLSQKFLVFLVLSGLIGGGYYMFGIKDAQVGVRNARNKLTRQRNELDKIKREFHEDRLLELEEKIARLKKQISANEKLLPARDDIPEFIRRIKDHADSAGLQVQRFSRGQKAFADKYATIPILMDVRGTTVQLVKFFRTLADPAERLVSISKVNISWLSGGEDAPMRPSKDQDFEQARRLIESGEVTALNPVLKRRFDRINALDKAARSGRLRAVFTVNAFTFLTDDDRANARRRH